MGAPRTLEGVRRSFFKKEVSLGDTRLTVDPRHESRLTPVERPQVPRKEAGAARVPRDRTVRPSLALRWRSARDGIYTDHQ